MIDSTYLGDANSAVDKIVAALASPRPNIPSRMQFDAGCVVP